jgi:hypothetical protein
LRVHRTAALVAGLGVLLPAIAHADDPHDLFGIGGKPKPGDAPESCAEPGTFGCALSTDPFDTRASFALSTWLPAAYLRRLPIADATHDAVAGYGLGASRDDTGPSFGGATGLENRWTVEGAPVDSLRTGGAETRIPVSFLEGITVTAGGFAAHDRASTGGTIDATLRRGTKTHEVEASVWGGLTSQAQRRPLASGLYYLRRVTADAGADISAAIVATGPLPRFGGGTAWYAAGIAPALSRTKFTWRTSQLVDANGDGAIDGLPGPPVLEEIFRREETASDVFLPAMARGGWDRGPHHVELTLLGHVSNGARFVGNATYQASGIDRIDYVGDAIATYKGRWKRTQLTAQLAWHRSMHRESAHDATAADQVQLLSDQLPDDLPQDPDLLAACSDMKYPLIQQCPIAFGYFASGGAGPLLDFTADRPTASIDVAHRASEHNVVRVGATLEDGRLVTENRFTGGQQIRTLFGEVFVDRTSYLGGPCEAVAGGACAYTNISEQRYRTRYTAAYVEDTWTPQEDLRVEGGLRWELMWVGPRAHFSKELAPRGGIAWDPIGGGRSRVWTSYGRSFVSLPAGLGPTVIRRDPTVHDITTNLQNMPVDSRDVDLGAAFQIADDISPMTQDELTAGIELGLAKIFKVTAWAQGRWLRYGLETTPHGFDNPGRVEGQPARRTSQQLALEIATNPTGKLTLRAGYLVGSTVGNYLGAYDPRQGAILYNGDAFDGIGDSARTSSNEIGRLPTDVGHRVFVEADRRGKVGPVGLSVAARLTLSSARPRSAFADTDVGVLAIIPRGSIDRSTMLSQANVRVAARWQGFDLTLDVFNAFDRGQATSTDEVYTDAFVRPIEGGTYQDLVFLKNVDGQDVGRRTAFGLPVAFQSPVSAVLGIHRAF